MKAAIKKEDDMLAGQDYMEMPCGSRFITRLMFLHQKGMVSQTKHVGTSILLFNDNAAQTRHLANRTLRTMN